MPINELQSFTARSKLNRGRGFSDHCPLKMNLKPNLPSLSKYVIILKAGRDFVNLPNPQMSEACGQLENIADYW